MIWDKKIKKRIIGLYGDIMSENLLIVLAAVHGNEKSGVIALENIFKYLKSQMPIVNGCILALKGNITAFDEKKRFIDQDLNRMWHEDQLEKVRNTASELLDNHEEREQKELLYVLEQFTIHRQKSQPFLFLDLHTTSAPGGLFTIVNGNDLSVEMAKSLQVPLILHLQNVIKNTTLSIFSKKEFSAIAFEAGQHEDPKSIQRMEAAIYILLDQLGIAHFNKEWMSIHHKNLEEASLNLPKLTSFKYKYHIKPDEDFEMLPGFKNFDAIEKNQILAKNKHGDILAPYSGYILMPLYQKQGEDGFFIISEE
jgi:succinylglutamate desuccinylase